MIHIDEECMEVQRAAHDLSLAVTEDYVPIITRIKTLTAPFGGPKGEISYARDHEAVWFKGKRFAPSVWAGTEGEEQIKQLKPAIDSKGKKVGEEWFTTMKVEAALARYHDANEKTKARVLELLRGLSAELQTKVIFLSLHQCYLLLGRHCLLIEGRRRKWVFPTLSGFNKSEDVKLLDGANGMNLIGLSPYWFDAAEGSAVLNTVDMQSLFLLTGPNGGGLMVPAESAVIPHFDSVMLHMKSYDSPADGKSSFQVEMSEIRSIVTAASSRSLVLVDEICRGTETAKGTCIAGSIIETLDKIGCLGIVSTHLHGIFDLWLNTKDTVFKAMGSEYVDGQTRTTWKLIDGICRESLAFETAQREGIPDAIIRRAEELYFSAYTKEVLSEEIEENEEQFLSDRIINNSDNGHFSFYGTETLHKCHSTKTVEDLRKDVESAITIICQRKLIELYKQKNTSELVVVHCVAIGARERPPPSTIGSSCVYVMQTVGNKIYVGVTDDLDGRVCTHRSKEDQKNASFLYFVVPGKSIACQLETLLINQLPNRGFHLTNVADGKHRNFGTANLSLESTLR